MIVNGFNPKTIANLYEKEEEGKLLVFPLLLKVKGSPLLRVESLLIFTEGVTRK